MEPKQILRRVTVTGADDSIDPSELIGIQVKYPYAEFGILLSQKYSLGDGNCRFPSKAWLRGLGRVVNNNPAISFNLSGHLCGEWVRNLLKGTWPVLDELDRVSGQFGSMFQRWQINTHAEPHNIDLAALEVVMDLLQMRHKTPIFQLDDRGGTIAGEQMVLRGYKHIAGLFDLSHGAGVLPSEWPVPIPGMQCGYAGGLSPNNVAEQLERIQEAAFGLETWIDVETHLRGSRDNGFDLDKVEAFLEAARPWVIQ